MVDAINWKIVGLGLLLMTSCNSTWEPQAPAKTLFVASNTQIVEEEYSSCLNSLS